MLLGLLQVADAKWQSLLQDLGQDGKSGPCTSHLVAPSHSLSLVTSTFPTILLPAPSAWLIRFLACLASGHCLSPRAPLPGSPVPPLGASPHHSCDSLKLHPWVTRHGAEPLPSEDENCTLVEVTEEEVENSVKHIPSLATVVRRDEPLTKSRDRESLGPEVDTARKG